MRLESGALGRRFPTRRRRAFAECDRDRQRRAGGQASVEWVALVALVSGLLTATLSASGAIAPSLAVPRAIAERLVCAVRLSENCRDAPKLERSYDAELAALLQAHAPTLLYEPGMRTLPVDYRRCREDACAEGGEDGPQTSSQARMPVTAFTHVVDCRRGRARRSEAAGADCSGARRGNLYLQYWFYYPGSATAEGSTPLKPVIRRTSAALGKPTFHPDDWESYQVRIGPRGRFARASSHHGHGYELGGDRLVPGFRLDSRRRLRFVRRPRVENGWGPEAGTLYVSGGSHAGSARIYKRVRRATKDHRLRLIPLRAIALGDRTRFAVTPPWRKRVFRDPEYPGTD